MREINIVDYVKEVESNRQLLIQHCKNNGKEISDDAALRTVVNVNSTINIPSDMQTEVEYCTVTWYDIDGTVLNEVTVEKNAPLPQYDVIPTYDPEYLEFVKWVYTAGIEVVDGVQTVVHDVEVGPAYRNKNTMIVEEEEVHPLIMRIAVPNTNDLAVKIQLKTNSGSGAKWLIDWGDGSEYTSHGLSTTNITTVATHTYANTGVYVIRIASTKGSYWVSGYYGLPNNNTVYVMDLYAGTRTYFSVGSSNSSSDTNVLLRNKHTVVFSTDMATMSFGTYAFLNTYTLVFYPELPLPNNSNSSSASLGGASGNCSYQHLIISNEFTTVPFNVYNVPYALEKLILPKVYGRLVNGTSSSSSILGTGGASLKTIILSPDAETPIKQIPTSFLSGVYNLKKVQLPDDIERFTNFLTSAYNLEQITLPKNLKQMTSASFVNCYSLKRIVFPEQFEYLVSGSFTNAYALEEILLPSSLRVLGTSTSASFTYSPAKTLDLPTGLQEMGGLTDMYNLEKLELPENLQKLYGTFNNLYGLKELIIPENLTYCSFSMNNAYSLKKLHIKCPSNVITNTSVNITYAQKLTDVQISKDFAISLSLRSAPLSYESLCNICENIKDLTGSSSKTLTVGTQAKPYLQTIATNDAFEIVPMGTPNSATLLQRINAKNWTVSFTDT